MVNKWVRGRWSGPGFKAVKYAYVICHRISDGRVPRGNNLVVLTSYSTLKPLTSEPRQSNLRVVKEK